MITVESKRETEEIGTTGADLFNHLVRTASEDYALQVLDWYYTDRRVPLTIMNGDVEETWKVC